MSQLFKVYTYHKSYAEGEVGFLFWKLQLILEVGIMAEV